MKLFKFIIDSYRHIEDYGNIYFSICIIGFFGITVNTAIVLTSFLMWDIPTNYWLRLIVIGIILMSLPHIAYFFKTKEEEQ